MGLLGNFVICPFARVWIRSATVTLAWISGYRSVTEVAIRSICRGLGWVQSWVVLMASVCIGICTL